eukprot:gb/GEZN01009687.1/.p1 GENE.gb/GEZN01009687.1/~~gb/GEZN01009687.1/.p1  ORF type:complete len:382 (-),score=24.28 gb/GEZN01009687.1/:158-1177(-)
MCLLGYMLLEIGLSRQVHGFALDAPNLRSVFKEFVNTSSDRRLRRQHLEHHLKSIKLHIKNITLGASSPASALSSSWNKYRIGDGINFYPGTPGCDQFVKSIVCAYQNQTRTKENLTVLVRILDARSEYEVPPKSAAVLHLRLGDGLCAQHDTVCRGGRMGTPDCWHDDADCFRFGGTVYAYSQRWYEAVACALTPNQTIIIISNHLHWTRTVDVRHGNYPIDEAYLGNVVDFFLVRGFDVEMRVNFLPDDDFAYMCGSQTFVQGGGGFSKLVASVVAARGGRVLTPSLDLLACNKTKAGVHVLSESIEDAYTPPKQNLPHKPRNKVDYFKKQNKTSTD